MERGYLAGRKDASDNSPLDLSFCYGSDATIRVGSHLYRVDISVVHHCSKRAETV